MLMIIYVLMSSSECKEGTTSWMVASTIPIRASSGSAWPRRDSSCPAFTYRFHGPGSSYVSAMTSLPCGIGLIPLRFTAPSLTGSFPCPQERVNNSELPNSLIPRKRDLYKNPPSLTLLFVSSIDKSVMLLRDAVTDQGWGFGSFKYAALVHEASVSVFYARTWTEMCIHNVLAQFLKYFQYNYCYI